MAFCTQCGYKLNTDARFCPNCGTVAAVPEIKPSNTEEVKQTIVIPEEKNNKKKAVILPLIFACAAILLEIVYLCFAMRGAPKDVLMHNIKIGNYFMALVIPAAVLILGLTCKSKGAFKAGVVVSFVIAGLQIIVAVIFYVVMYTGGAPIFSKLIGMNGNQLFVALQHLFRSMRMSMMNNIFIQFIRLLGSALMIVKNVVSGIAFAKLAKRA